jgi:hypothetical protein
MNIFKELKKAPKVKINEVSYGYVKHNTDNSRNSNNRKSIQKKLAHAHYMSELHKDPVFRKKWEASRMQDKRVVQKQKNIELVMPYFEKHLAEFEAKTYSWHCEYSSTKIAEYTGLPRHNVLNYLRELRTAYYSKVDTT